MPRKKVNGNIIGARWQDIRHRGEIIAVNRRVGGLENIYGQVRHKPKVNRRVGGLEIRQFVRPQSLIVNRRVGGLENAIGFNQINTQVSRRVGGLES